MDIINSILNFVFTMFGVGIFTFVIYAFYYGAIYLSKGNEKKKDLYLIIAIFIMTCIYLGSKDTLIEIMSL